MADGVIGLQEQLSGIIGRFDRMDERFDRVEVRLDRMDERLDRVDERFGRVDARFDQMDERFNHRRSCMLRSLSVAVLLPAACALVLSAAQPTGDDIAAGLRIYRQKADCQACHGWAGDGRKMDSQMPDGANLRVTALDREKLIVAIRCGIPGRSMPAFDRLAYSDGRCYGMTAATLKTLGTTLPDPAATLQPREIEQVADFLLAKVVGKGPMTRDSCIEFWGAAVDACSDFK